MVEDKTSMLQQWFTELLILDIEGNIENNIKTELVLVKYSTKKWKIVLK